MVAGATSFCASALGDRFVVERLAGGLEEGVRGVEAGHGMSSLRIRHSSAASGSGALA